MGEMIRIMSVKEYFDKYAVEGIGKGADVATVKNQIIDSFRNELFSQLSWKLMAVDFTGIQLTPKNKEYVDNLLRNTHKKWNSLVKLFQKYKETFNVLTEDDFNEMIRSVLPGDEEIEDDDG